MTEKEIVERIMSVRSAAEAEIVQAEVQAWLYEEERTLAQQFRVRYQAEFLARMRGQTALIPPD